MTTQQTSSDSINLTDMLTLARSRLDEAEILYTYGRFNAASYLCGYAMEFALKVKISRNFKWSKYPPPTQTGGDCDDVYKELLKKDFIKTHKLTQLICLSGITKDDITQAGFYTDWQTVVKWNPENRYKIQSVQQQEALDMIDATKRLSTWLLGAPL